MLNKQKIFLIIIVLVIISIISFIFYHQYSNKESASTTVVPTPEKIKIMTFNINHGEDSRGSYGLKEIIEIIRRESPDFVTINDIDSKAVRTYREDQARKIAGNLGMYFTFGKTTALEGGWNGNAILSKYPLKYAENRFYKNRHEPENQALLYGVFAAGEQEIHIFTTELAEDKETAEKQSHEIVDRIMDVMSKGAVNSPVLLAGSLNLEADHVSIKGMRNYLLNATGNAKGAERYSYPGSDPKTQRDYIFYRKNLNLFNWEMIRDNNTRNASDHLPLTATFTLN